uniref:G_PROTEIN_RECEP_F1_2 domain-containing protein n=1 Tax=Heterorhabditis bacteriophora TaxID=37862 RepID=A0A1I7WUH2_HETBA
MEATNFVKLHVNFFYVFITYNQNCSNIFVFGRDEKYALCNITSTETPCQLLKKLHLVKDFRMYFFIIIPIVLSAIALILNITYLILQICVYIGTGSRYERTNASDRQRSFFVAMNRLGMNMATFAVGSVPILIVCIVALSNLKSLSSLGEGDKSPCKTFIYSRLFVQVEILASVAAIVWLLAMILDPVINTMADYKLMETLKKGVSLELEVLKKTNIIRKLSFIRKCIYIYIYED